MNAIKLRPAKPADIDLLRHWDEQPHTIESDPNDDWNWEEELQREPVWREQLIAELDGRPLGVIQIIDPQLEDSHYWGDIGSGFKAIDIWIGEAADLGKGYGTIMMELAIARCFADSSTHTILLDPLATNTKAHRFYERLGFQFVRKQVFNQDECYVYALKRESANHQ